MKLNNNNEKFKLLVKRKAWTKSPDTVWQASEQNTHAHIQIEAIYGSAEEIGDGRIHPTRCTWRGLRFRLLEEWKVHFHLGYDCLIREQMQKSKKEKYVRMQHIKKFKKHKFRARQKRKKQYINVSLKITSIG